MSEWTYGGFPPRLVRMAAIMHKNSGYSCLPSYDEVAAIDPQWYAAIQQALRVMEFHSDDE